MLSAYSMLDVAPVPPGASFLANLWIFSFLSTVVKVGKQFFSVLDALLHHFSVRPAYLLNHRILVKEKYFTKKIYIKNKKFTLADFFLWLVLIGGRSSLRRMTPVTFEGPCS